jgi:hypothetical protein
MLIIVHSSWLIPSSYYHLVHFLLPLEVVRMEQMGQSQEFMQGLEIEKEAGASGWGGGGGGDHLQEYSFYASFSLQQFCFNFSLSLTWTIASLAFLFSGSEASNSLKLPELSF